MTSDTTIPALIDKAREEMIFIGPDHPYYPMLAGLVSAIGTAWQQGYDRHRDGGPANNPYSWAVPDPSQEQR